MKILFPHNKFLHEKILPRTPLSPPTRKSLPWKSLYIYQKPLLYVNNGQSL